MDDGGDILFDELVVGFDLVADDLPAAILGEVGSQYVSIGW